MANSSRVRDNAMSVLAMAGITEPPIDIDKVAETLGFKILPHPFPEQRKGMVHIEGDLEPVHDLAFVAKIVHFE
jgi:hypothetical protein